MSERLNCVEALRIEAVLAEMNEKLGLLALLTPNAIKQREEMSQRAGDDISRMITDQRELESRFETLIANRATLKGMANKARYRENLEEIKETARQLRQNTKTLVRSLKDNPNVADNILKIQNECNFVQNLINRTVQELREQCRFSSLPSVVEEEQGKQSLLQEVMTREKEASAAVKNLQQELESEKKEHEKEIQDRSRTIAKLKEQVKALRGTTDIEIRYATKEAKAHSTTAVRTYNKVEGDLDAERRKLQTQLKIEERVNKETEEFLKRRHKSLQDEVERWDAKYEQDGRDRPGRPRASHDRSHLGPRGGAQEIEEKTREYQDLKYREERDVARLNELMEIYRRDQEEAAERSKREAEEAERRAVEEAIAKEQGGAAAKIQAVWRRRMVQIQLKKSKGGKKKGKGKGKGAKGKKK
eukprot:tig00020996_g16929.t1